MLENSKADIEGKQPTGNPVSRWDTQTSGLFSPAHSSKSVHGNENPSGFLADPVQSIVYLRLSGYWEMTINLI